MKGGMADDALLCAGEERGSDGRHGQAPTKLASVVGGVLVKRRRDGVAIGLCVRVRVMREEK